jgi:hypothetical protein
MRRDALARNDDGTGSTTSSTAVSQEITAERALSTPPWTPKLHRAGMRLAGTPMKIAVRKQEEL